MSVRLLKLDQLVINLILKNYFKFKLNLSKFYIYHFIK